MKAKISVVTVVYNDVHNVEDTIVSVLSQNYDNFEYVIIDGGSTDGTWDIIKKYSNSLSFAVSEKDAGIYDAMNKSLFKCSGDYIIFMNSGDKFASDDIVTRIFSKNITEDIVFGDSLYYYNKTPIYIKAKDFSQLKYQMPFNHQAVFVKRELLLQDPFNTNYRYAADYDFFHKQYQRGTTFLYFSGCVSEYHLEGGATHTNMLRCYKEVSKISNKKDIKSFLIKLHVYLAYFYYKILPQKWLNYIRNKIY